MKKSFLTLAIVLFGVFAAPRASAVTVSFFYDALEPHGEWLDVADYGYVWQPRDTDNEWRPYTAGHWVFTDAGWTWVSDEPFGWATYHYGRWARLVDVGWVWVPDVEWAPAWVSWRRSPSHVGWAPLPPEARFHRTVAISSWADAYYDIGPTYYSFVQVRQFGAPRLREVLLPSRENITIIHETRNITNITYRNNFVYSGGPEYDVIARESAQPIRRLKLERRSDLARALESASAPDALRSQIQGETLRVIAPPIEIGESSAAPKRIARRVEKVEVNRGWRDVADRKQADQLRVRMKSEAKLPAELPPQPKFERLAARQAQRDELKGKKEGVASTPPASATPAAPNATGDKPESETEKPTATADRATRRQAANRKKRAAEASVAAESANDDRKSARRENAPDAVATVAPASPATTSPVAVGGAPDSSRPAEKTELHAAPRESAPASAEVPAPLPTDRSEASGARERRNRAGAARRGEAARAADAPVDPAVARGADANADRAGIGKRRRAAAEKPRPVAPAPEKPRAAREDGVPQTNQPDGAPTEAFQGRAPERGSAKRAEEEKRDRKQRKAAEQENIR